jgi:hypothetical protein
MEDFPPEGRSMLKTTAAAIARPLARAMPALAQKKPASQPPQKRIHERLDVNIRDAEGETVGRIILSDVTTSHSAVEGHLRGPDGFYVFYCEPTILAESNVVRIIANAKSAVADLAHVLPLLSCPAVELQGGGPPKSLSLHCEFEGRREEVIRRAQSAIKDEPPGSVSQDERVASTACVVTVNGVQYFADGTLSRMKETRTGTFIEPPQFP